MGKISFIIMFCLAWVTCGIIGAGMFIALLRHEFPNLDSCIHRRQDVVFSVILGIMGGPISLIAFSMLTGAGAAGWTLSTKPCRES
jgi:hypothetical protein